MYVPGVLICSNGVWRGRGGVGKGGGVRGGGGGR